MDNKTEQTGLQKQTVSLESVNYNRSVISNHAQLKSREYDKAQLAELGRRLNSIAFGMGFNKLELGVIDAMTLWIKRQFGDISMQEIALAFELVTAKKLPMGANQGRHYAKFDMQYVGDALHAYKEYRAKQLKTHKESEAQKLPEYKGATDKEMYEGMKKYALDNGKVMRVGNWTNAYNHAWKENLIHQMNATERELFKSQVEDAMETEERAGFTDAFTGDIQSECHRRILQSHFQTLIDAI